MGLEQVTDCSSVRKSSYKGDRQRTTFFTTMTKWWVLEQCSLWYDSRGIYCVCIPHTSLSETGAESGFRCGVRADDRVYDWYETAILCQATLLKKNLQLHRSGICDFHLLNLKRDWSYYKCCQCSQYFMRFKRWNWTEMPVPSITPRGTR